MRPSRERLEVNMLTFRLAAAEAASRARAADGGAAARTRRRAGPGGSSPATLNAAWMMPAGGCARRCRPPQSLGPTTGRPRKDGHPQWHRVSMGVTSGRRQVGRRADGEHTALASGIEHFMSPHVHDTYNFCGHRRRRASCVRSLPLPGFPRSTVLARSRAAAGSDASTLASPLHNSHQPGARGSSGVLPTGEGGAGCRLATSFGAPPPWRR